MLHVRFQRYNTSCTSTILIEWHQNAKTPDTHCRLLVPPLCFSSNDESDPSSPSVFALRLWHRQPLCSILISWGWQNLPTQLFPCCIPEQHQCSSLITAAVCNDLWLNSPHLNTEQKGQTKKRGPFRRLLPDQWRLKSNQAAAAVWAVYLWILLLTPGHGASAV